jgi:regulator of replication initiation timing
MTTTDLEALHAEIDRLQREAAKIANEWAALAFENGKLRAEIDALRELLLDAADALDQTHCDGTATKIRRVLEKKNSCGRLEADEGEAPASPPTTSELASQAVPAGRTGLLTERKWIDEGFQAYRDEVLRKSWPMIDPTFRLLIELTFFGGANWIMDIIREEGTTPETLNRLMDELQEHFDSLGT